MERTPELRRPVYVKPGNHTKLHYALRFQTVSPEEHEIKPQWIKAGANRGSRQQNKAWIKNLACRHSGGVSEPPHLIPPMRPLIAHSVGGMAPSTLRRCISLMEARLEGDLGLGELASEAGLSTSHFIRSFRESTGKTPYQFLLERRVQRAQTLLRDPRASLAEIARSTGFADQHHLARVFRRITGITSSTYRRSL